jgi:D-serine deaminase-like pyridoxal phosphate-dependent protein
MMNPIYLVHDTSDIFSPALLFYKELIGQNIALAIKMAGRPERLRPHVKTHKTRELVRMQLVAGITRHKCATLAEAEMLATCGVPDVLVAYPLVGPNCQRMARLVRSFPECRFSALVDHPLAAQALAEAMTAAGQRVDVLIDIDVGQQRTGIAAGESAASLYALLKRLPGLEPGGIHVYDGHNHQGDASAREAAVRNQLAPVLAFRETLEKRGLPVPRLVLGGTPTFPIYARMDLPGLECTPGTCFLHDHGYGSRFADLGGFTPAALLLTRVISRPAWNRVTLDLGYKAVASDPPAGQRCVLLNVPEHEVVLQNEEHLVIETAAADRFSLGDEVYAVPTHICPTCALHRQAYVVQDGEVTEAWEIVARDRMLSI